MYLFVTGFDGALWYRTANGAGSGWWTGGWTSLGGQLTSSPSATSWSNGVIDVTARGADGALWQIEFNNGWQSWTPLGGQLLPNTGPAGSSWAAGRLDLFTVGKDLAIWHKYYQSGVGWSGWETLGGVCTSSPAAASRGAGLIDVHVRGKDSADWSRSYVYGGWSPWTYVGGQLAPGTGPALGVWYDSNTLVLLVTGIDHSMWQQTWTHGWVNLGGYLTSSPTAATTTGWWAIEVYVRASTGNIWQLEYYSGAWQGWKGGMEGPPCQYDCY